MLTKDKEVEGGSEGPQNVMCTNQFSPCVDFFCFGSTSPLVGWAVASLFWQSHLSYFFSSLANRIHYLPPTDKTRGISGSEHKSQQI